MLVVGARIGDPRANPWVRCPFHLLTGLDCPGCGSLRAMHQLAHGDVAEAVDHNAALVVVLAIAVAGWSWRLVRPTPPAPARWRPGLYRAVLLLLVCWTVARNIPLAPFDYLAA